MKASILIVSKNRKSELEFTLNILALMLDFSVHEVLVFLDGCTDNSLILKEEMKWVDWYSVEKSIGASAARHQLYPKANGQILIGLDDDAHPLNSNFIEETKNVFNKYPNAGIVTFQEIKGVFDSDLEVLKYREVVDNEYRTNEFIGCGFAIRKEVYQAINGFPVWVDIYGEESCVSIEVLAAGFDIVYSNKIKVNHRVNKDVRKKNGQNYFRFGKQLKNTTFYFLVYYPFPLMDILKLYWHNFRKYALKDVKYFKIYFKIIFEVLIKAPKVLKYRHPVEKLILKKRRELKGLHF